MIGNRRLKIRRTDKNGGQWRALIRYVDFRFGLVKFLDLVIGIGVFFGSQN